MEKTKDGPFHKDLNVDMTFLWYIMHHIFWGNTVRVNAKTPCRDKEWAICVLSTQELPYSLSVCH